MAQRSRSSRSSSGRSSGRGSSRPASRGAGARSRSRPAPRKSNAGPTILAAVVVLGVLALVIALAQKGGDDTDTTTANRTRLEPRPSTEETPKGPTRLPPPQIPQNLKDRAAEIVREAKPLAEQGEAAYRESLEAKTAGDDDLWQDKLQEASNYFGQITDLYNELIIEIDESYTNRDWDAEQVANHYFGRDADAISRYLRRYQDIRKQRRR